MISIVYWCEFTDAGIVKLAVKAEAGMPDASIATSRCDWGLLQLDGNCTARWIGPGDCRELPSYDT